MIRNALLAGALSLSVVAAPAAVLAGESPLPAGGPAAQGDAGLPALGSVVEIGGVLFVVTVAGLVLLEDDDDTAPTTPSSPSSPSST